MNVREILDTVKAKVGLLAGQESQADRQRVRTEVESHIDDLRATLGMPHDVPCCCGCGSDPLQRCSDCRGMVCDGCLGEGANGSLCEDCSGVGGRSEGEAIYSFGPWSVSEHDDGWDVWHEDHDGDGEVFQNLDEARQRAKDLAARDGIFPARTIHIPSPDQAQVAALRGLFLEKDNGYGLALLDLYEDEIQAAGGWDSEAARRISPSQRFFGAMGIDQRARAAELSEAR